MPQYEHLCPVERITNGPFHHFFGYYEKTPWDASGRFLLGMAVAPMARSLTPDDMAVIGMVDRQEDNRWIPLRQTLAWCWQQGTMLQWLGGATKQGAPDREIIFNTRSEAGFGSTILNVQTGASRDLPRPVYGVDPLGRWAVTLNYARVQYTRPGYGYVGVEDAWRDQMAPAEDGITFLDLRSGESRLIISLARIAAIGHEEEMDGVHHWFNHLQFNPSGTRFAFLHRWKSAARKSLTTRLFTSDIGGENVCLLEDSHRVSHFDWCDDRHILAWSRHDGAEHYHMYVDQADEVHVVGADVLPVDGHCSFSPDGRWVLSDTYPRPPRSERTLFLYHLESNTRGDIGHFYSDPAMTGEIRCDLHPRWDRTGHQVCIDSIHEGERQMYVVDVSAVVG